LKKNYGGDRTRPDILKFSERTNQKQCSPF